MTLTPAFDDRLNVRVFSPNVPASACDAERWLGAAVAPSEWGVVNVLVDGLTPEEADALKHAAELDVRVEYRVFSQRAWCGSAVSRLRDIVRTLTRSHRGVAEAILASLIAFERGGPGPPTHHAPRHPSSLVMGVLNVTPDSFSDGGRWLDAEAAVARGLEMVEEGADVIDVGGESTRPGAVEAPVEEELRRVLPVVEKLRSRTGALISIDTRKAEVAAACLEAGADWINDVSGLTFDPRLADVAAQHPSCKLVLMHSRARPEAEVYSTEWDEQGRPVYEDVVADTLRRLRRQARFAVERGVDAGNLWIDPGFGFGKTFEQNLTLLRRVREYTSAGLPVLVGTSRKSSVGRMLGDLPPDQRLEGTAATVAWAVLQGAGAVRVHDVKEMARIVKAAHVLRCG